LKFAETPASLTASLAALPSTSLNPIRCVLCVLRALRGENLIALGDDYWKEEGLQSKKNQSIHFMPSLIRKLFHKSEAPKDGLTQPQREAMVDLLNYCMYADNLIFLAEDRLITDTVAKFNWDPKVPFDQFDARSVSNARNASESQVYRDQFLASIKDRLDTAAVKGQALELCQELFLADGAQSYEEDDVLQNLRQLLE